MLGEVGQGLSAYGQDVRLVLGVASQEHAHVMVNGISHGEGAPDLLANVVLQGEGTNDLMRGNDLACKTGAVRHAVSSLEMGTTPKQLDTFQALVTLAGNLEHNPSAAPVDVVLLAPLDARGGGVDLRNPATLVDPVKAINDLARQGLIPSCRGWRLYGVSPNSGLTDAEGAQLREFWRQYAEKCGGVLVSWTDHLSTFPATGAISAADTSQIHVHHTSRAVTATLGSDVLFAADSAALQPAATPNLDQLLTLARRHAGPISITGYVNPVGSGGNTPGDIALSKARARAVQQWLVNHAVKSTITTTGMGTARAVYPHPRTASQAAANRRVVVVIRTRRG